MSERFILDTAGELIDMSNGRFIDYGEECCELLNKLNNENNMLRKHNMEAFGLLGSVRVLAREEDVTEIITRIDKFERGMQL